MAATFAERSAVRLAQPSARLECAETALDLTGDLTLEVDLVLDKDSPAGVLVGRGTSADGAAGLPYELSLTDDGRPALPVGRRERTGPREAERNGGAAEARRPAWACRAP